ncbi:2,3-bisphosphoglycerate-dependent phosphoglycerate mutase [Gammaproteobacteria bacterium]|jgi:2,3-bisphosphoglycerate-dependent phosphoglycerate mutase|nr:2,3-bisphosphoglycerate-dependent phosphoglycerate mutase [Gammaproteobacteria bacterium]|tara:strand:+ start:6107 stop:6733 length:627 start_codon:yes stop_codon:yes gene_type:complete
MKNTNYLVLVRHGQSEWNAKNLFTGWKDPGLTDQGIEEAVNAGISISARNIEFARMFTSALKRAQITGQIILDGIDQPHLKTIKDQALNERDYGDLAGLNKDAARKEWGEEQVHIWRRSYDIPPPGGESLKNTAERVLPYFNAEILPRLTQGENILVAAHGNSLRSLVMQLDNLSKEEVIELEIPTGAPIIYTFSGNESPISKENLFG